MSALIFAAYVLHENTIIFWHWLHRATTWALFSNVGCMGQLRDLYSKTALAACAPGCVTYCIITLCMNYCGDFQHVATSTCYFFSALVTCTAF